MANKRKPDPNSPFSALKGLKDRLTEDDARSKAETVRRKAAEEARTLSKKAQTSDEDLFLAAMSGVKPIDADTRASARPRPKPTAGPGPGAGRAGTAPSKTSDEEVLDELQGMVDGTRPLDFTDSDEFVEGRAPDCSLLELSKLRRGELAVQDEIDLHGLGREEARAAVEQFFANCQRRSYRCVNIICGRGLHSEGGRPVLKDLLVRWFARGRMSYDILAFSSAKRHDGGVGAIYVLLRRRKLR